MEVIVRVPGALRADSGGQGQITVTLDPAAASQPDTASLARVLDELADRYPRLGRRLRDERGGLRRYVNVFVDGEECRRLSGLATTVTDGTELLIIPSVAGG